MPEAMQGGDDGARRRARGLRLAGAALPDQQLDPIARRCARELDVGAVGKGGVVLDQRAEPAQLGYVKLGRAG